MIKRFGWGSDFLRNTLWLTTGTGIAQIISFVTAPVLTRIYIPADYGLLGVYMVFCALLSTLSTLQYNNAIVIAENDEESENLLRLAFFINIAVSMLALFIILLFHNPIARLYNNEQLKHWLYLAPVSVFFVGINAIFSAWAIRKKQFKLLSRNRIYTALLAPVLSIGLGIITSSALGLFIGLLASQVLPTLRMAYFFNKADQIRFSFDWQVFRVLLHKYRNFPRFSLPSDFINNFSNQIPVLIIGQVGGAQVVGWYNLAVRMMGLPSTLVANSVGEVFRQRATSDYHSKGTCRPIFIKVLKLLLLMATPPFLLLMLFGPQIFLFVFGKDWEGAGRIVTLIGVLYYFKFVVSPLTYVTYIAQKQWVGLLIDILLLLVLGSIYILTITQGLSYTASLLLYSLSYSSLYFITFYFSYKYTVHEKYTVEN